MNQVEVKRRQIGLFSYMIGIVTIWLLSRQIGDGGVAYITVSIECYAFLWVLLGGNVTSALGRMLRSKNAKGQYKNASVMKKDVLIFQGVLGVLGSIIFYACARLIAEKVFRMPHCVVVIQILAPIFFLRCISSVFLGYLQGEGTQLAEAVSCVLRQVLILGFGLLFCGLRKDYGEKISKLLLQEQLTSAYSSAGFAIAMSLAEVLIILFLLVLYKGSGSASKKRSTEGMKTVDSFGKTIYSLYAHMGIDILVQLLSVFPLLAGLIFYQRSSSDTLQAVEVYGGFLGKYLLLCGLAALPLCALILPITVKTVSYVRKEEQRFAKMIFQSGMHISVVNALLPAALVSCLADQIAALFGGSFTSEAANMLRGGSFLIVFTTISFYFSNILIFWGKRFLVFGALGLYNILFIVSVTLLLRTGNAGIMALVYGGIISCFAYGLMTGFLVCRQLRCAPRMLLALAAPVASACIVGLLCLLLGKTLTPHLGNGVAIIVCVVLGTAIYWAMLLLLRNFKEQELDNIPGGRLIRIIGEMLRVF